MFYMTSTHFGFFIAFIAFKISDLFRTFLLFSILIFLWAFYNFSRKSLWLRLAFALLLLLFYVPFFTTFAV